MYSFKIVFQSVDQCVQGNFVKVYSWPNNYC